MSVGETISNVGLGVAVAAVVALVGCSATDSTRAEGTAEQATAAAGDQTGERDLFDAEELLAFFGPTQLDAAALPPQPRDIEEAVGASDAVVIAEVVDVQPTRTLVGETERDQLEMIGVVLRPVDTLHGDASVVQGELVVELLSFGDRARALKHMRSSLPTGQAVWILRDADIGDLTLKPGSDPFGDPNSYYNLTHLESGLFVQGDARVVAGPWGDEPGETSDPPSVESHAESFPTLDQLITYIESIG